MHSHDCHPGGTGQILKWSFVATLLFVVLEVVAGLQPSDAVILDPADSLVSGALVRVRPTEPAKPGAPAPAAKTPGG